MRQIARDGRPSAKGTAETALNAHVYHDLRQEKARRVERMRWGVAWGRYYDGKDGVHVRGRRAQVAEQVLWPHRAGVDWKRISSKPWMSVEVSPIAVLS